MIALHRLRGDAGRLLVLTRRATQYGYGRNAPAGSATEIYLWQFSVPWWRLEPWLRLRLDMPRSPQEYRN